MKKTYKELVIMIRDAIREKAMSVPDFRNTGNGAIRITTCPYCADADEWLGGFGNFKFLNGKFISADIVDYEHCFSITPGGSRTITTKDKSKEKVDCYAFSAMKVAHCSLAQEELNRDVSISGSYTGPQIDEEHGYAPYAGAICISVKTVYSSDKTEEDYCDIYISVSGADSEVDDVDCAFAAAGVIRDFFREETHPFFKDAHYEVNVPTFTTVNH